jgi:hypothetical protein
MSARTKRGMTIEEMDRLEESLRDLLGLRGDIWFRDRIDVGQTIAWVRFVHRDGRRSGRLSIRTPLPDWHNGDAP